MNTTDPKAIAAQDRSVLAQLHRTAHALEYSNRRRLELCDELNAEKLTTARLRDQAAKLYRDVNRGRIYRALLALTEAGGEYMSSDAGIALRRGDAALWVEWVPATGADDLESAADEIERFVGVGSVERVH